jgi:23S rRNA pseudouridine1911/1915/1917 synthase
VEPASHNDAPAHQANDVILTRQALHACRIKLAHPATKEPIEFVAPLPTDMQAVIEVLQGI